MGPLDTGHKACGVGRARLISEIGTFPSTPQKSASRKVELSFRDACFTGEILHHMGIDHTKLTYKFEGRQSRLTDISCDVKKLVA